MQKGGPYVGFQSVDFGVNSDISVGEDGFHLCKCIFRFYYPHAVQNLTSVKRQNTLLTI